MSDINKEKEEREPMPDNQVLDNLSVQGTKPKIGDLILIKRPGWMKKPCLPGSTD